MNTETEPIFSSTGRLGVSRRQYERLYVNGTRFSSDPQEVERNFQRLTAIGERNVQRIGRSIFRGAVSDEVMSHISRNGLQHHLEVAFPLEEFTGDNSWLIYMANNRSGREQIVPHNIMVRETEFQKSEIMPADRIRSVIERGYAFTNQIPENQVDQVHSLWGETFGWERHEVDNLRRRLETASKKNPSQRDVWFGAIRDNGNIISAAMAERLTVPAENGMLDLVESTEWRTRDEYAGKGLMTAALAILNAQILSNLQEDRDTLPLIYAECNFQSRSDRAGYGAGFRIPYRTQEGYPAPQILVQNVLVRDGSQIEEGRLRDFTFMYLPRSVIQRDYSPVQTNILVGILQS
ncbi:MAG: hypothetical protein HYT11_00635 [Candidatus Levybacteria bacterium]|nr:hypothetical protein [Candidatus Levybacteria bacterium]